MSATAAIILDFTKPQRSHNCPRADGILKNLSVTAAIVLDFTMPQRVHNCSRANGIKKTSLLQQQLSLTSQSPIEFTIVQERMVFKKNWSVTAASILDFTKPRRHNCPRADGIKIKLVCYSSNYP